MLGINEHRRSQLLRLMEERGWDSVVLYGHGWRRDFFRALVNVNYLGDHAAARLTREGELQVAFADEWDCDLVKESHDVDDWPALFAKWRPQAVAGLDFMEQRFVAACGATPTNATADVEELRRVKTTEEIALLKRASDLADRGYQYFVDAAQPGMTEYELVAEVEGFLKENGAEDNFMLVASGGTEVVGMKPPTERILKEGDQVITELTPSLDGYYAQVCRTLVLGKASQAQRDGFAIFAEAQQAAEDLIRPGVTAADAAKAQNDVFRKYGYGDYTGAKYTRVRGHCLGLFPDETPHVLEDVPYVLKENMVMIAHPNTYLPLAGYTVFGDAMLVIADGNERLNRTEKKLFEK